jgi:GDP-4-dehydro-6-deoxy-D-mannose reductase
MRAFITGIAGFAGMHLAEHLRAGGDEVLGCSLSGSWNETDPVPDRLRGVQVLRWNIVNSPDDLAEVHAFAPDVVFHLAAVSKPADVNTPEATDVNVLGTPIVVRLVKRLAVAPRVVCASSSYVYAAPAAGAPPVREDEPLAPRGAYGQSKADGEALLAEHIGDLVIARLVQHTGPRQTPHFMLPEWCLQFARGGDAPIEVQNSESWIDLSDVRDVAQAYRALALEKGSGVRAYNVGSGRAVKTGDVLALLREVADPRQQRTVRVASAEPKFGPIADIRKITAATGWRPKMSLAQTVEDTYRCFEQ